MYKHAIVRLPGANFAQGLTPNTRETPDIDRALLQHEAYIDTLRHLRVEVKVLEADEQFPDGCFVEDTAVLTDHCAIITNPGAPSRRDEVHRLADVLRQDHTLEFIQEPGTLEGGDVLRIGDHFFIGLSARTNLEGATQLQSILEAYGYSSSFVEVQGMLHLKSGVAHIGDDCLILTPELAELEAFQPFDRLIVEPAESYAANCLLVNDHLLMASGYPQIRNRVKETGREVIELDMSEFRIMDGGLTCLSLLW